MGQTPLPPDYQAWGQMRVWDTWDCWCLHLPSVLSGSPDSSKRLTRGPATSPSLRLLSPALCLGFHSKSQPPSHVHTSFLLGLRLSQVAHVALVLLRTPQGLVCNGRFVTGGHSSGWPWFSWCQADCSLPPLSAPKSELNWWGREPQSRAPAFCEIQ